MRRFNNGLIYTNDNCIACNKCINQCSIFGANVSVENNGKNHIEVDSRKCNDCGKCINLCSRNAREFRDDVQPFFDALAAGEKISVVLAPSFYVFYGDKADNILGYLKSIGVDKIYDVSYGAEISVWATVKYIRDSKKRPVNERAFISNACPALVNVIEKYHPFLISKLIPVHSPMMCTAIYANKYLGDKNTFAFLGPCVAKKDELNCEPKFQNIKYSVTFDHFMKHIDGIDITNFHAQTDLPPVGFGEVFPSFGSFSKLISQFLPREEEIIELNGFSKENMDKLYMYMSPSYPDITVAFVEQLACKNGCINGPGVEREKFTQADIATSISNIKKEACKQFEKIKTYDEAWNLLNKHCKDLSYSDFERSYTNRSRQPFHVPESTYNEIYNDMLKDTPEKRKLNCGSCGYQTCHEMARAIAHGYNHKENCIHYMNDLMLKQYSYDELTGLYNRNIFAKKGDEIFIDNPDKTYIVVSADINKLKIVNDLYGFDYGNGVLKMVSATIKQIINENEIVARLGGGSFAMLLENTVENLQKLQSVKIFDCSTIGINFPVTMRCGLYMTSPGDTMEKAMNCASLCMDKKISAIKNTYNVYTKEIRDTAILEANMTAKMQKALENEEFIMYFQPQYTANDGVLIGAEALCRWKKSDGSLVSPGLFIPIAEKNGFVRNLDKEIWRMTFAKIREWIDAGVDVVPISLNISRVSLESDSLYYEIKRLKNEYKIPEEFIHFEVTESAYMAEEGALAERIEKIRSLGYKIAMDDFGSAYSSLNALKDLPIDVLKLDMGFVRGNENMDKGGTIIANVVRMAQDLEFITVAEGVETQEQAEFLRSVGVNIFQGYLYAKPMPEEDFLEVMKEKRSVFTTEKTKVASSIDVQSFYTPDSPESIMFEEFTGPAAIYEYDDISEKITIIRANRKYLAIFGMENLQVAEAKKQIRKLITKQSFEDLMDIAKKNVIKNQSAEFILEFSDYKKGLPLWVKNNAFEIKTIGHKHLIYTLAENITDAKITESTLEISNEQMELIMNNSQVGMCLMHVTVDLLHFQETIKIRVLKVNRTFTDVAGFSEEEVLVWTEKEALSVIHPMDRPGFLIASSKAFLTKYRKPYSYVYRAKNKNGYYVRVKIYVSGIKQSDKSYMLITNYVLLSDDDEMNEK